MKLMAFLFLVLMNVESDAQRKSSQLFTRQLEVGDTLFMYFHYTRICHAYDPGSYVNNSWGRIVRTTDGYEITSEFYSEELCDYDTSTVVLDNKSLKKLIKWETRLRQDGGLSTSAQMAYFRLRDKKFEREVSAGYLHELSEL